MDGQEARRPLPTEPLEARQRAGEQLVGEAPWSAVVWALLAIAGELHEIRKQLRKGR